MFGEKILFKNASTDKADNKFLNYSICALYFLSFVSISVCFA